MPPSSIDVQKSLFYEFQKSSSTLQSFVNQNWNEQCLKDSFRSKNLKKMYYNENFSYENEIVRTVRRNICRFVESNSNEIYSQHFFFT